MELDDGSRMRAAKPINSPRVDECLAEYREICRRMDAGESIFYQNAMLAAKLETLELGELKVYYREVRKITIALHVQRQRAAEELDVLPEPPVSWS